MNYVIISPEGNSFYLIPRLNAVVDVAKIYYCLLDTTLKEVGKNLNEVSDYSKLIMCKDYNEAINTHTKEDLIIIIDDVGLGETGKHLRDLGYKVIGGGVMADRLENDRTLATNLMAKVMAIPETFTFQTFEEGMVFLKGQQKEARFVFKPHDGDVPKEYTYVSKDVADLLENMKEFKTHWKWETIFQLQKFIKGTEVDFNAYFNGKEYLNLTIYFENKPIMNDDVGASGGGAIATQVSRPFKGVFADILEKIKPVFIKDGYKGCVAINSIVDEQGKPHFIEFTNRFGYPSLPMDITSLEENGKTVHDLCMTLVHGEKKKLFAENKPSIVVSVGVPPYPSKDYLEQVKGLKISWDKQWDTYFFASSIMSVNGALVLAGGSAECLQITCCDETIDGASAMLYDTYIPTLRLKGAMYRTDCGKDAKKRLANVKDFGLF
jgi:phosphoribosylamine-glycine ligase